MTAPTPQPPASVPPSKRQEFVAIVAIAAPLAAAYLAEFAIYVTDMMFVGRLGTVELAAVGLAGGLIYDVLSISIGVISIVGVLVAQAHGRHDKPEASRFVRQGLWIAAMMSLVGMGFCLILIPLLSLTGQEPDVLAFGEDYTLALMWSFPATMIYTVLANFLAALGRAHVIMAVAIASVGLNLVVNYTLVFGHFGFPALGVAGAGYGTVFVSFFTLACLAGYVRWSRAIEDYMIFPGLRRPEPRVWGDILRHGLPIAGITIAESGMFSVVAILMGLFCAAALAASQIVFGVIDIGLVLAFAIAEAAAIRVAYGIGAGEPQQSRNAGFLALAMGSVIILIVAAIVWSVPELVVGLFLGALESADTEVTTLAISLFTVAAIFQIFDGLQMIAVQSLRGLKDTLVPMLLACLGLWGFGVTGGYLLGFVAGWGPQGLWWGLSLGLGVTAILLVWRFHARTWRLTRDCP